MNTDTMYLLVLAVTACLVVFILLGRQPYKRASYLFTPAERNFYKHLVQALNGEYLVFGKVRVADLVTLKSKNPTRFGRRALAKVAQKHVDFCLCDPSDLSIKCVLELNDKSHSRSDRMARDKFLSNTFKSVGLPIIWVTASRSYNHHELRDSVRKSLGHVRSR